MRALTTLAILLSTSLMLAAQDSTSVDTTSAGYKIGYSVGQWLPFSILIVLVLMVMFRARKLSKD